MLTQPERVDTRLTVERESSIRRLAQYNARLLCKIETSQQDERAYANLLAELVERVQAETCRIIRSAINPSEQTRILAVAYPWLRHIQNTLQRRAYTTELPDGTMATVTVTEWVLDDDDTLMTLMRQADDIIAETVRIDHARRPWNSVQAPPVLYEDKLQDLRDRLMPERGLGPWIKFGGIRQWLNHCDRNHTTHCRLSPQSREIFAHHPRWLVDVERRCLVEAGPNQRYLALSYVWGTHASFQTLKGNVKALQENCSLLLPSRPSSHEPEREGGGESVVTETTKIEGIENISRTVADVIEFVDRLDERYLWVDALCIVQDDDADKQQHLAHMGSIYANAYATIVVINGPSNRGLSGIQDVTRAMHRRARADRPCTPYYTRRPETMASAVRHHAETMRRSVWNKRAWTFQEQIFSRRLLILDDAEITWECHCNVWLEGIKATESQCARNGTAVVAQGFSFHLDPQFRDYALHARQYNRRQFSYPEDSMDAFAGILTVLRTTFLGGFICCLPVMFFDTALLWYNDEGMVEARTPKRRRECDGGGLAPTWTWAAYGGKIAFPDFSTAKEGVRPLVRWKYCRGSEQMWTPVPSLEKQQAEKRFPTAAELSELVRDMSLEDGGPVAAGEPSFPVGVGSVYHHLLHARPQRAVFNVLEYYGDEGVPLVGVSGECVGVLTPCMKLGNHTVGAEIVISCELVAVSESFINNMETYNVLWIEKRLDVYVRKGVGRILKSDWVAQKPERIDLLLM